MVEDFTAGAFPVYQFMISNLGSHDGQILSKETLTNFFVDRALASETLAVYGPGTQSRNFVHVKNVAWAYLRSAKQIVKQLDAGETGVEKYELTIDEDPSVMTVAEWVAEIAAEERGLDADV